MVVIPGDIGRLEKKTSVLSEDELVIFRNDKIFRLDSSEISNAPAIISEVTTSGSLDEDANIVLADATSAPITINLPTALSATGRVVYFKKINSTVNDVTIDASGSETIDESETQTLTGSLFPSITIVSNGSEWFII